MDYRTHLFRPLSKRFVDHLVLEVFANPADFEVVYQLIFDSEIKVAWRAAWACQKISEKHPEWFSDKNFMELSQLALTTPHDGLKRGCLAILYNLALPNPIPVDLINACFDWMILPKSAIAVQAYSMKLLYRICVVEPDFRLELIATLENVSFDEYSPGFKSTANNILKALTTNKFNKIRSN